MNPRRLAAAVFIVSAPTAAQAADLYSPALPASAAQFLECRILNATGSSQAVIVEAFDSTGTSASGPHSQTLSPGEAGGFSLPGTAIGMYCKFTVKGSGDGFRASIDTLEPTDTGFRIVAALPAR